MNDSRRKQIEEAALADLGNTLHSEYELELWCRGARWGMNKEHENAKLCPSCGKLDANPMSHLQSTEISCDKPAAPSEDDERDAEVETRKWARSCRKLMGYKNGTMRISEDDYKAGFLAGRRSCKCRT